MTMYFTGDFKELKGMGYSFHKMYAGNHICYRKEDVRIWKKGKDVEMDHFYDHSDKVLQYLIDNNFTVPNQFNIIIFNQKTNQIEEYDKKKHESVFLMGVLTDAEMDEFYKTYEKTYLTEETIVCVKELYEKGWIEIREDTKEE